MGGEVMIFIRLRWLQSDDLDAAVSVGLITTWNNLGTLGAAASATWANVPAAVQVMEFIVIVEYR